MLAYVHIGRKWVFTDPIDAFESAFFFMMGLNMKYPYLSQHVWTFFQKGIYKIVSEHDGEIPSVNALINELS